jgi:hypothetical protein
MSELTVERLAGLVQRPGDVNEEAVVEMAGELLSLRDEKIALLLIVDDCHRIMEERADKIDAQDNILSAINESLAGLEMPVGDRTVMLANVRKVVEEVDDWRESARKAADEPCGDEKHCACVGLLREQITRQRQRIIEWHDENWALREAVHDYLSAEGSGGTFDAVRVMAARKLLKEIMEEP